MADTPTFERGVWVSYSGADKALVYQLTQYVAERREQCKFTLFTYLCEDDGQPVVTAEPQARHRIAAEGGDPQLISFLAPGQRIEDLIKTIGANLRRALFISEAYLQSLYCLKELMCCLIRKPYSSLYLATVNLTTSLTNALQQPRQYDGYEQPLTVPEVLASIYRDDWDHADQEFTLSGHDHDNPQTFFTTQLNDLTQRLLTPTQTTEKKWHNCILEDSDEVEQIFTSLTRYVNSFNHQNITSKIDDIRQAKLTDWFDTALGQKVKEKTSPDNLTSWLKDPEQYNDELTGFCVTLENALGRLEDNLKRNADLQKITSILLTAIVPRQAAAELHHNTLAHAPVRVAEPAPDDEDALLYIHATLAAAFNHNLKLTVDEDADTPKIGNQIELPPLGLEENPPKQYDVLTEIQSLVCSEATPEKQIEPVTPTSMIPKAKQKLRSKIRSFNRREGDTSIILTASLNQFDSERGIVHDSISQFLKFINSDLTRGEKALEFCILLLSFQAAQQVEVDETLAIDLITEITRFLPKEVK